MNSHTDPEAVIGALEDGVEDWDRFSAEQQYAAILLAYEQFGTDAPDGGEQGERDG